VRLRGATPPHGQFPLVLERPRDLTVPIRASRHPDHPPTTTVASTVLRIGARASRSSPLRPVKRWPDSRLRGRRLLGPLRCPRASAFGRFVLVVVAVPVVVGSASGFRDTEGVATVGFTVSAARGYIPPAESLSMSSFKAPSVSGSVRPTHRTYEAVLGLSVVRRRPASTSPRPVPIRSHLTPGCSGLASLVAEP